MKLLAVVTPPSIYHGCFIQKTFWEGKFRDKENLFLAVDMKMVAVKMLGNKRRSGVAKSTSP